MNRGKKIVRMSADPAMCDLFSSPRAACGPSSKCAACKIISTPLVMSSLISLHKDVEDSPARSSLLGKETSVQNVDPPVTVTLIWRLRNKHEGCSALVLQSGDNVCVWAESTNRFAESSCACAISFVYKHPCVVSAIGITCFFLFSPSPFVRMVRRQ